MTPQAVAVVGYAVFLVFALIGVYRIGYFQGRISAFEQISRETGAASKRHE